MPHHNRNLVFIIYAEIVGITITLKEQNAKYIDQLTKHEEQRIIYYRQFWDLLFEMPRVKATNQTLGATCQTLRATDKT